MTEEREKKEREKEEWKISGLIYDHQYDDIINLPQHKSPTRAPMSLYDRAAQFAPFAALTGHEAALAKTLADRQERIADEYK